MRNRKPVFVDNLAGRVRSGGSLEFFFHASTLVGIFSLLLLLLTIINSLSGLAVIRNSVQPESLAVNGVPVEQLSAPQLAEILHTRLTKGLLAAVEKEKPLDQRSRSDLYGLVVERVIKPKVEQTWSLTDSLFRREAILAEAAQKYPGAQVTWKFWLNWNFLASSASSDPLKAGVRTALLGSLWVMVITVLFAFPVGVGAAVYLEEYAADNRLNRLLKTNITNLAGVPSIIYGILGLAIFVRALVRLTSGAAFGAAGAATANGRTLLSAGLTLGLLVLPLIIINAQEAIRAVPGSLRHASLSLGASHWQTVWHHVLPSAMPGILTGTILAVSRSIGETAPLVVVGAATFINFDPNGPFSKFTTLPIQIYQWTARPQGEFRNIAAAAIVVLLIFLLSINATAIVMRNRLRSRA